MGCSTCKSKKSKKSKNNTNTNSDTTNINLIPESFQNGDFNGNFILKLMAFIIIILGWPLISLALYYVLFVNFFIPKKEGEKVIGGLVDKVIRKYASIRANRIIRRKEKEFESNRNYSGDSELLNIEVFTNKKDNNTEDSE
jgi:hypothetical protein